jgi:hypothetical protein
MPRLSHLGQCIIIASALCLALVGVYRLHAAATARRDAVPPERDTLYLPEPAALRVGSLGHTELMADLVWIRQVLYFADQFTSRGDFAWLDRYLRTVAALDPHFRRPYVWAGVVLIYNNLPVTNAMVRQSNEFLEAGLKQFPDDWELHFMLGANYLNEMKTSDKQLKERWRMIGAEHMRRAALSGKAAPWVPVLVATVLQRGGETQAALRHLEEVLLTTEDDTMREHVRNKLLQLQRDAVPGMLRFREDFDKRWRAQMPYASSDLYVVLGDPPKDVAVAELAIPEIMRVWEQTVSE